MVGGEACNFVATDLLARGAAADLCSLMSVMSLDPRRDTILLVKHICFPRETVSLA